MNRIKFNSKIMGILVLVLVVATTIGVIFTKTFSIDNTFNGIKLNDITINNVNITNIEIKEENGISKYQAKVKATEEKNIKYVRIVFKDENNKEIVSLIGYVGSTLKKDETRKIEASTDADLSQVKSIDYEII